MRTRVLASGAMKVSASLRKLKRSERRSLARLTRFATAFPLDAVLALSPELGDAAFERLLSSGLMLRGPDGFHLEPTLEQLVRAVPVTHDERARDDASFARWLLGHIASLERSAADTDAAFDWLAPLVPDVRATVTTIAPHEPSLAAELWCAISDLLFYRRVLAFDVPEYEIAVAAADRTADVDLQVRARIALARASLEIKPPAHARPHFERARDLAEAHGRDGSKGDALRGLGWVVLAEGDLEGAKALFAQAYAVHEAIDHPRGLADACMALGVVSTLSANRAEADARFFRAEAILRSRQDTARLKKLATLRHTLGMADQRLALAPPDLESLLARGQYWRGALLLARCDSPEARQRAEVLADLAGVSWKELMSLAVEQELPPSSKVVDDRWRLRREGGRRLLAAPDGTKHDLTRRGPMVKLLAALSRSGGPIAAAALFEAAWPGEKARHEASLFRVYTTVRRLRALGVPIATSGDGYFCDRIDAEA